MIADVVERLEAAKSDLEMIRDEEQEAFDNMPEGLQGSERGEAMEEGIYQIEEAMDGLDSALDSLQEVM
jgi:hypothetical protein